LLGCLHFLWLVKADWREPALYLGLYALLMGWRWQQRPRQRRAVVPVGVSARRA
jgi:sulfoxide reductase heme-binding subunit YedZ